MVRPPIALLVVVLLALGGCHSAFVGRAQDAYEEGRYLEVAESLAAHEDELHTIPRAKQAQYGLYRGLALLKLGDYDGVRQWLTFVEDIERAGPTLDPSRKRLLEAGRAELQAMLRYQNAAPAPAPPNGPPPDSGMNGAAGAAPVPTQP